MSVLGPGDALLVRAGTYAESLHGNIPSGTSWSSPVTVQAFPGEAVTLRPNSGSRVLHFQGQCYITVAGLVLDAANVGYDAVKITYGYTTPAAHHIRIVNCEIKNAPQQGILITGTGADHNELIGLDVHDNGTTDFHHGIYLCTDDNLVQDCSFHGNAGWGIHIYSEDPYKPDRNVVRGCRSYSNGACGGRGAGIGVYSGTGNVLYNNLTWNDKVGVAIDYGASDTLFCNNVIYGSGQYGLYIGGGSTGAVIRNNIICVDAVSAVDAGGSTAFDHNHWSGNPELVDPAAGDFRPLAGSPVVDAGTAVAEVTADMLGVSRPQGGACDIGAYELAEETNPRPTPVANLRIVAVSP